MDTLGRGMLIPDEFIGSGTITSNVKRIHNHGKSEIKAYQKVLGSMLSIH